VPRLEAQVRCSAQVLAPHRASVGLGVGGPTGSGSNNWHSRPGVCIVLLVRVHSVTGGRSMATTEDLAQIYSRLDPALARAVAASVLWMS